MLVGSFKVSPAWFLTLAFVLTVLMGCVAMLKSDVQATGRVAEYYSGVVTEMVGPMAFRLDCCDLVLELGKVAPRDGSAETLAAIETSLRAEPLACTAFSKPADYHGAADALVWCRAEKGGNIADGLIEAGYLVKK